LIFVENGDGRMDTEVLTNKIRYLYNKWLVHKAKDLFITKIIKAPDDVIDYIIIHESCHLKIQGHSHHFWSFLKQFVPDYEKKIDWLDKNNARLIS
jgi:predicted metal-dependent hydrolase